MEIPTTRDLIQKAKGELKVPEIRVWCHPHMIGMSGDDYYRVFESFEEALAFIRGDEAAEDVPLIAFRGFEINIFEMRRCEVRT